MLMKKLFMGNASHLPTWVCTGHSRPESQVTLRVNISNRQPTALQHFQDLDVTSNHLIVELRPQLLGIMLSEKDADLVRQHPEEFYLSLHDPEHQKMPNYCIGKVGLRYRQNIDLHEHVFVIFETTYCKNYCLPAWRVQSHFLYERVKLYFDNDPHTTQKMTPQYLFSNWLLFSLPRAVALVSFDDGEHSNMFPMDLIGATDSPYYLLSLTSNDPSLPHILNAKKLVVSHIPLDQTDQTYAMGKNHKQESVGRKDMIVETKLSPVFKIPVPSSALCVRELNIVDSYRVDYHTIIVTNLEHFKHFRDGLHMCHVQRIYQRYLLNHNRALLDVERQYQRD